MAPTALAPVQRGPSKLQKPEKMRYFKGKPLGTELDDEDSDEDEDEEEEMPKKKKKVATQPTERREDIGLVAGGAGKIFKPKVAEVKMELGDIKVGKAMPVKQEEDESSEEEEDESDEEEQKPGGRSKPIPKPPGDESSEYETDSEEESEEEKKPVFRPVFIKKDQRGMTQEKLQAIAEEKIKAEEEMIEKRKNDSKEMAGETIRREIAEKEAGDIQPDIDDTDGLDPTLEFEQWRARELARLLRDKQAQAERDAEKDEIERRRAMPEEQRLKEDMEYAQTTRDREKGEMGFLQKYYHKGAFYSEDNLLSRDYTGATESQMDMSMLPQVMQVRDFGKASRTKYTHLADQDTSQGGWGQAARLPASMSFGAGYTPANGDAGGSGPGGSNQQGCWNCGGPHLRSECPNANVNDPTGRGGPNAAGPSSYARDRDGGRSRDDRNGDRSDRPRDSGYGSRSEGRFRDERRDDRYREQDQGRDRDRDRDRHGDRGGSSDRRQDNSRRRDDRGDKREDRYDDRRDSHRGENDRNVGDRRDRNRDDRR